MIAIDFDLECGLGVTCAEGLPDVSLRGIPLGREDGMALCRMVGTLDSLAEGLELGSRVATEFGTTCGPCIGDRRIDGCVVGTVETPLGTNRDGERVKNRVASIEGEFELLAAEESGNWLGARLIDG